MSSERVFALVEHPWFQRLRRIQQLGLGSLVYPGAIHSRFQHALGAMHLMGKALAVLKAKGHEISDQEVEAAAVAILLHDIGNGPFSHALEQSLAPGLHHERLSLAFFEALEQELGGPLALGKSIFNGSYPKRFLHELVSSQLDVDRLDYLTRDTYFTGVHEGAIGTNRIIDMLDLDEDGRLVVEAKGIYSIEKFLVARRIMYWQVYLHKTVLCAEQMLIRAMARARQLVQAGEKLFATPALTWILLQKDASRQEINHDFLAQFAQLDDSDIWSALKVWSRHSDPVLSRLSASIVNRRLFRIHMQPEPFDQSSVDYLAQEITRQFSISSEEALQLLIHGQTENSTYNRDVKNIRIRNKNGTIQELAQAGDQLNIHFLADPVVKHYLCYPKDLKNRLYA